jgi:Guanine nucleotide exchange factor in Golgi transport N-terminal
LLKKFFSELETEAEIILTLLIKHFIGETDASEPRPGWMRVLTMEIMRG